MTDSKICERVMELDRLYLAWDALARAYDACKREGKRKEKLRREANRAWRKCQALVDKWEGADERSQVSR